VLAKTFLKKAAGNFFRRAKLSQRDCLYYWEKEAKSGDMAVLEIRFRFFASGKWSKNRSFYRRQVKMKDRVKIQLKEPSWKFSR